MLFDIRRHDWDDEICAMLGIDPGRLPEVLPSSQLFGTTNEFGGEVPVAGIAGDQQAALFGQACNSAGSAKNTYGTGSFVLLHTGDQPPDPVGGLLSTVACETGGVPAYALEASIFVTGAAIQWLRDGLGIVAEARETEGLAASLDGNDGVYFVPALTGLGSPHWDPYARGTIVGLTRGSGRAHLARAALEAIAYQTVDAVRAQEAAAGRASRRAQGRRRRRGEPLADAVPGRRPRRPRGRPRGQRDDGARSRLSGRDRDRALERGGRRADLARVGPLRAGDERRSARLAPCPVAAGRSSARGAGTSRASGA